MGTGNRGIGYTPFLTQAMGGVSKAISNKRRNTLARDAWMGDPSALQELAGADPELASKVEAQATKRKDTQAQRGFDQDKRFQDDLDRVMEQIGAFDSFDEAQGFGQRAMDMMGAKYPERMQQFAGADATDFDEAAWQEIHTIMGGNYGDTVGVAFRGVNDQGQPVMYQQHKLPNGRTVTKTLKDEDGNTITPAEYDATLARDLAFSKGTGAKEAVIDLEDEAALAKLSAEAKTKIMPARKSAQETIGMVTAIKNHPGLSSVTGLNWLNPIKFVPGSEAHNFQILAQQAQGKVFEQAYETLKGGGPITEIESRMASQAIARMDTSQSQDEYVAALNDFETAVRRGYDILLKQARGEFETDVELPERMGLDVEQYTRSNPATPASKADYDTLPAGSFYQKRNPDTGALELKRKGGG